MQGSAGSAWIAPDSIFCFCVRSGSVRIGRRVHDALRTGMLRTFSSGSIRVCFNINKCDCSALHAALIFCKTEAQPSDFAMRGPSQGASAALDLDRSGFGLVPFSRDRPGPDSSTRCVTPGRAGCMLHAVQSDFCQLKILRNLGKKPDSGFPSRSLL